MNLPPLDPIQDVHFTPKPVVELSSLKFAYSADKQNSGRTHPLIDVDGWCLYKGQKVFLQGNSGTGKSTLLQLICGVLQPQSGEVRINEQAFSTLSSSKRDRFRALHIGMVFQQFNLVPYLTVLENVKLANYFANNEQGDVDQRAAILFEGLQLSQSLFNQRADQLSVGQQQRVAIARAMINAPQLLITDEPTSALDSSATDGFIDTLVDLCEANQSALLFVSHDQRLEKHFDQTIHISEFTAANQLRTK
ncbi:ABC transporter ATP-binding protein [Aliiglaciecola sp. LCG003]|uniref:ABC transporter ATP-binding protein n=1 Tax=Aliiglaciecola sp. LCG003 TaxID=3053655 RepID=UPI002573863B|nr:ABC transporter ATP-binding protein [Aliiglaciecola sp. LCG003]WJG10810.1 ABC transporter ATP-binding protein [Aliiglaciecola sp. LCG003]